MAIPYDPSRVALYSPEKRETIFIAGHTYSPLQLAVEASRLAYIRAETSASELRRLTEALARVDFAAPTLFIDAGTGTQAFGAYRQRDATMLIAFRGTQPDEVADLATDLLANKVEWPESAGRVHAGFAVAARAVLPSLRRWLDDKQGAGKLILTGHSLGAALATLAATVLRPASLITLGSPRVGDTEFTASLAGAEITRLVNCCDAVTEVPPPIGGYIHVKPSTYLTRNADRVENPAPTYVETDRQHARLDYMKDHAWKIGSVLVRDLADHAPINYARVLFP